MGSNASPLPLSLLQTITSDPPEIAGPHAVAEAAEQQQWVKAAVFLLFFLCFSSLLGAGYQHGWRGRQAVRKEGALGKWPPWGIMGDVVPYL